MLHGSKSRSVMDWYALAWYVYVVARCTICKPVSKRKVMTLVIDVSASLAKSGLLTLREYTSPIDRAATPTTSPFELNAASVPSTMLTSLTSTRARRLAEVSPTFS